MTNIGSGQLTNYNGSIQYLGASSGFDIQAIINASLKAEQYKIDTYYDTKDYYQSEKGVWSDFKGYMNNVLSAAKNLQSLSSTNQTTSTSKSGVVNVTATGEAVAGTYSISVGQLATAHKVMSNDAGSATTALGYEGTLRVNGKDVAVTSAMSLKDVAKAINANKDVGVDATVVGGSLFMTSRATGASSAIAIEKVGDGAGGVDIAESLGLINASGSIANEMQKGQDAVYTIEGITRTSSSNTVTDAVADMTFTLVGESAEAVQVGVTQNNDALVSKMKEFVNAYNNAIGYINAASKEGGILQGESLIRSAKSSLNGILSMKGSNGMMLFELGVQGDGLAKDGTIKLDETKFKEAVKTNYEGVMKMLTGTDGVAKSFYDKINEFTRTSGMIDIKTDGLSRSISRLDEIIEKKELAYEKLSERLLAKYSKMETALSSMNSTLSYLTAQVESWNKKD